MSAVLYDKSLLQKIKYWTEGTNVHVYGTDETKRLFETIADESNDAPIKLPIICLSRSPLGYEILNVSKKPTTYDGIKNNGEHMQVELNHIPISLSYQIDVYAKYYEEADAYMREIIFNLINAPTVDIVVPYLDVNVPQRSAITVGTNVEDLSSVPERLIAGQFTRLAISFTIPDAHLFDVRQKGYIKLNAGILDIVDYANKEDIVTEELDFGETDTNS